VDVPAPTVSTKPFSRRKATIPEIVDRPIPVTRAISAREIGPSRRMQSRTMEVLSSRIMARSPVRKTDTPVTTLLRTFDTDKTKSYWDFLHEKTHSCRKR